VDYCDFETQPWGVIVRENDCGDERPGSPRLFGSGAPEDSADLKQTPRCVQIFFHLAHRKFILRQASETTLGTRGQKECESQRALSHARGETTDCAHDSTFSLTVSPRTHWSIIAKFEQWRRRILPLECNGPSSTRSSVEVDTIPGVAQPLIVVQHTAGAWG
jgi:hypothetical protein